MVTTIKLSLFSNWEVPRFIWITIGSLTNEYRGNSEEHITKKKNPHFKIEYYFKKITICKNNSLQTLIETNRIFRYFFFIPTKLTFRLMKYVLTNFVITLTRESQTKLYFYWFFSLVLTVIENIFVFHLEYMHFHIGMSKVYICDIFKIHECDRRY